jgi:hypothetical protein
MQDENSLSLENASAVVGVAEQKKNCSYELYV